MFYFLYNKESYIIKNFNFKNRLINILVFKAAKYRIKNKNINQSLSSLTRS